MQSFYGVMDKSTIMIILQAVIKRIGLYYLADYSMYTSEGFARKLKRVPIINYYCNKYCDPIGQSEVSISHRDLQDSHRDLQDSDRDLQDFHRYLQISVVKGKK